MTAQRGDGVTRRATTREELIADMPREWTTQLVRDRVADALVPTVDALVAEAERRGFERGRESVGLGDFLPNPCGDEYSSYPHYIAETYGDYVTCSRSRGHDGQHEHSDSGMTWSTR